jgi:hypothetical protein
MNIYITTDPGDKRAIRAHTISQSTFEKMSAYAVKGMIEQMVRASASTLAQVQKEDAAKEAKQPKLF